MIYWLLAPVAVGVLYLWIWGFSEGDMYESAASQALVATAFVVGGLLLFVGLPLWWMASL